MDELAPWVLHKMENMFDKYCCFSMISLLGMELVYHFIMENEHIASVVMALMRIVSFA